MDLRHTDGNLISHGPHTALPVYITRRVLRYMSLMTSLPYLCVLLFAGGLFLANVRLQASESKIAEPHSDPGHSRLLQAFVSAPPLIPSSPPPYVMDPPSRASDMDQVLPVAPASLASGMAPPARSTSPDSAMGRPRTQPSMPQSTTGSPAASQSLPSARLPVDSNPESLFVKWSIRVAIYHANFEEKYANLSKSRCGRIIYGLAVSAVDSVLYYLLADHCWDPTQWLTMSVRRANLSLEQLDPIDGDEEEESLVVTYWWPYLRPNGSRISRPISNEPMARLVGLATAQDGTHLFLCTSPVDTGESRTMASVSTVDGSRVSVDAQWSTNDVTFSMDPNKTTLYRADPGSNPLRIYSTLLTDTGLPLTHNTIGVQLKETTRKEGTIIARSMSMNFQSVIADGSCLYFSDTKENRIWGLDPRTFEYTLVAGMGQEGSNDGDGRGSSFRTLSHVVTTPDGCNVFVTQDVRPGSIRWLKLDTPCTLATSVTTVLYAHESAGFMSLAMKYYDNGNRLRLYVATTDGVIYELEINKSSLHKCAPRPSPPDWAIRIAIPITVGFALVVSIVIILGLIRRQRHHPAGELRHVYSSRGLTDTTSGSCSPNGRLRRGIDLSQIRQFDLAPLLLCTSDFDKRYQIGEKGAFGEVYRGHIDGKEVAIKVMTRDLTEDKRKQFVAEVNALSRVNHVNLIELIGYCEEGNRCILVYPYYQGGSLHGRLHGEQSLSNDHAESSRQALTLEERMSTAFQIALALNYLHGNTRQPIIHRDIKSSNILLNNGRGKKLHAVLADFGLATMGDRVFGTVHQEMVETSHIGGTFGYMAPEYLLKGELSEKNDVYAFGMLVLEMLTGRKVVTRAPTGFGVQTLREWVKPFLEGGVPPSETKGLQPAVEMLQVILDPCLRDEMTDASATDMVMDMIQLAWVCVNMEDTERPKMSVVVHRIQGILEKAEI